MRWLLAIIAILIVAFAIHSGLLAYGAYVLLGMLLLTRLLTKSGLNVVRAERSVSANEIDAGERLEVEVEVENTGNVPAGATPATA